MDNCHACCLQYQQHIETERLARADLERRFEDFKRQNFIRRETLVRATEALREKTTALINANATVESLSAALVAWQRLANEQPLMTLADAMAELRGITDPLDVARLEDLPRAAA